METAQQGHCQGRINMERPAGVYKIWHIVNYLSHVHTHLHSGDQGHRVKDHGETMVCSADVLVTFEQLKCVTPFSLGHVILRGVSS